MKCFEISFLYVWSVSPYKSMPLLMEWFIWELHKNTFPWVSSAVVIYSPSFLTFDFFSMLEDEHNKFYYSKHWFRLFFVSLKMLQSTSFPSVLFIYVSKFHPDIVMLWCNAPCDLRYLSSTKTIVFPLQRRGEKKNELTISARSRVMEMLIWAFGCQRWHCAPSIAVPVLKHYRS